MDDVAIIESQFADKTAAEYRSRGYEVSRNVNLEFLPGFQADLLVQKGGESTVIAVRTRTSLALTPAIDELVESLSEKPDWSFELLLVGEPERLDAPESARPFTLEDILDRVADAEHLLESGFVDGSFVLAWSACEASIRSLVSAYGIEITRVTQSSYVLGHAAYHGLISEADDQFLSQMLAYRNATVHGFTADGFYVEQARDLIAAARTLHRCCGEFTGSEGALVGRVDLRDVPARLDSFRNLTQGWMDGREPAPDPDGLQWLADSFHSLYPDDIPLPHTFPTHDGGVQMEWSLGKHSVILEINLDTRLGEWLLIDDAFDVKSELELDLDNHADWERLCEQIRQVAET